MTPETLLSELIRLKTVNPPGNEIAVARFLKQLYDGAGIPSEIIEPEQGRATIIARLGSGGRKLLYLSHSDVVGAGGGWHFDPFCGEIKDGMVYGRGALDCKGLLAAQVYATLKLAKEAVPLDGQLIVVAAADEEAGGTLGLGYIVKHCPEKIQANFAVNEGADFPVVINGRQVCFIQVGEKGVAWTELHAHGKSSHGSTPTLGENAVIKMARAVNALSNYKPAVLLIPQVRELLQELVRLRGLPLVVEPENVNAVLESLDLDRGFLETLRSMTCMTVSPNVINGGNKTNIVPDYCRAESDIRILPGQDRNYVLKELRSVLGSDINVEVKLYQPPNFSPTNTEYYSLLKAVMLEMMGETGICLPYISAGSTDSKYLRRLNIPTYGVGHLSAGGKTLRTSIHGINERTDIAGLHLQAELFTALARKYLS